MNKPKVIIIGGGAAGFFAAINLARLNHHYEVIILEKTQKLLSKVKVSGGGRCNVTHACFEPKELSQFYPRGQKELIGPFNRFAAGDTLAWFSERGVEIKMEDDGRMFPTTDSSQTIIDCFQSEAKKYGVKILTGEEVVKIDRSDQIKVITKSGKTFEVEKLVVATGGNPKSKHYELLTDLGHYIHAPIPSLFTFNLPKHASNDLMGLSYPVTVKLCNTKFEEYGPLLFTHWGMSGPAILKLSSKAAAFLHKNSYQFEYEVDWLGNAEQFIQEHRNTSGSKTLQNTAPIDMPKRLWSYLLERAEVELNKNWADLSREELDSLQELLSADKYRASGKTTFKEEFVTCGGIELKEVNMKTMESKLIPGLYFCGEILNIDALTGGFNFQAAWTSGMLAAEHIAQTSN
jgi:predicted Rossmann fold flavoprotein